MKKINILLITFLLLSVLSISLVLAETHIDESFIRTNEIIPDTNSFLNLNSNVTVSEDLNIIDEFTAFRGFLGNPDMTMYESMFPFESSAPTLYVEDTEKTNIDIVLNAGDWFMDSAGAQLQYDHFTTSIEVFN